MIHILLILAGIALLIAIPYIIAALLPNAKLLVIYALIASVLGISLWLHEQSFGVKNDFGRSVAEDMTVGMFYILCVSAIIGAIAKVKCISLKRNKQSVRIFLNPLFVGIFLVIGFVTEQVIIVLILSLYFVYTLLPKFGLVTTEH